MTGLMAYILSRRYTDARYDPSGSNYLSVSTFSGVTGDTKTLYYLTNDDYTKNPVQRKGFYIYNGTNFIQVGANKEESASAKKDEFIARFGDIALATSTLNDFQPFINWAAAKTAAEGEQAYFAPYKDNLMVQVYVDKTSADMPLSWSLNDKLYALTSGGIKEYDMSRDYIAVSTFDDGEGGLVIGDERTIYYLTTPCVVGSVSYQAGAYIYRNGYIALGCGDCGKIGNLSNLKTQDKSNIVAAVNELHDNAMVFDWVWPVGSIYCSWNVGAIPSSFEGTWKEVIPQIALSSNTWGDVGELTWGEINNSTWGDIMTGADIEGIDFIEGTSKTNTHFWKRVS